MTRNAAYESLNRRPPPPPPAAGRPPPPLVPPPAVASPDALPLAKVGWAPRSAKSNASHPPVAAVGLPGLSGMPPTTPLPAVAINGLSRRFFPFTASLLLLPLRGFFHFAKKKKNSVSLFFVCYNESSRIKRKDEKKLREGVAFAGRQGIGRCDNNAKRHVVLLRLLFHFMIQKVASYH